MKHLGIFLVVCLFFLSGLIIRPSIVFAEEVLFQDDFSNGLEKWHQTQDLRDEWKVVDGHIEAFINQSFRVTQMVVKDQYWKDSPGYDFHFDLKPLQGVDFNTSFGIVDSENFYGHHLVSSTNLVYFNRVLKGRTVFEISHPLTFELNRVHHLMVRKTPDRVQLYQNGQLIADDRDIPPETFAGKIGLIVSTGAVWPTKVEIDNVVVYNYPVPPKKDTLLNVPLLKQSDPQWKNEEYDSAKTWTDRITIQSWGCAMTSAAMVMKYYGMHTFPDGTVLNPSTLNTWLKSQKDGYLQQGALNWQAVTRLTRLISEKFGTPKLEYMRFGPDLAKVKSEILASKPVILHINGHFLVGDGVSEDRSQIFIKDPSYAYTKFSQHTAPFESVRTFTPSYTDLSYLLFSYSYGLGIGVTDPTGASVANDVFMEHVRDASVVDGQSSGYVVQREVAKPVPGTYELRLKKNFADHFVLHIYAYDKQANPSIIKYEGFADQKQQTFSLNYSSDGQVAIVRKMTFGDFLRDLSFIKGKRFIKNEFAHQQIERLGLLGMRSGAERQVRYIIQMEELVRKYSADFTVTGRNILTTSLSNLKLNVK